MPGYPILSNVKLREAIRLATIAIHEKGEIASLRALRKHGVQGSTTRILQIKNELIKDGFLPVQAISLPPQTGKSYQVSPELKRPPPVSHENLRSSVLSACQAVIGYGEKPSIARLRNAGARGSDQRITWMVRYLKEAGLLDDDYKMKDLDAPLTFTERMVRLYPGGRKRLRREFSTRLDSRKSG